MRRLTRFLPSYRLTVLPSSMLLAAAVTSPLPAQDTPSGCDLVAAIAADVARLEVTRGEGVVPDYITGDTTTGCLVRLQGQCILFGDLAAPTDFFREKLLQLGWREDLRYAADGPTETGFALRRGAELCLFHGGWEDRFWMTVGCVTPPRPGSGDLPRTPEVSGVDRAGAG